MMKRLFSSLIVCASLHADVHYNLLIDQYFTPYIGAEDILSAYRGLEELENLILKPPANPRNTFFQDVERLADLVLIWEPINYMGVVTQHEVFGHGFWVRTLPSSTAEVKKYTFGKPPPYGPGGGATRYDATLNTITAYQELAITAGGVEATAILANRLKLQWLQRSSINPHQCTLYLYSQQDLTLYTLGSTEFDKDGSDIKDYVHLLNKTYSKGHLTIKELQDQTLVNLLDPFTYYAIYDWFYYIFTGRAGPLPMIPFGSYHYLPGGRLGLTPFGPEYYFENYLVKNEQPIYFYARYGNFAHQTYWGFGIEHAYLWTVNTCSWGLRFDFWQQPHIAFSNKKYALINVFKNDRKFDQQPSHDSWGFALSAIGHIKLWHRGSLYFQLGGKTVGYLPGEPFQQALIARVGLTLW